MTDWIPVTERLPEHEGMYLVTEEFAYMKLVTINAYLTEYSGNCMFKSRKDFKGAGFYDWVERFAYEKNDCVIAWAELPDAYGDDEEEIEWTSGEQ